MTKTTRGFVMAAIGLALTMARGREAAADAVKCKEAIAKQAATYVQKRTKALQKCEDAKTKGKLPATQVCAGEPKTQKVLGILVTKLGLGIASTCGGPDKTCGNADDEPLPSIGWAAPPMCPDFANSGCTQPILSCADVAACIQCTADAGVGQAIALYYGSLDPGAFATGSAVNKCQQAIGKATAKFLAAKSKALQKCRNAQLAAGTANPCPDGTASTIIGIAEQKKMTAICKACGGPDKLCDGTGDLAPATVGFVASCPAVSPPGEASCAGPIDTMSELVACVDCVTEAAVDCLDALAVPEFVSPLPAECNPTTTTTTSTSSTTATTTASTTTTAASTTTTASTTSTTSSTLQCVTGADCPGTDTDCATRTCIAGVCGVNDAPAGTSCSQDGGTACDGSGSCLAVVSVVRVGDGVGALGTAAAPVFVESRLASGAPLGSPIALPVAVSGSNQPLTLAGNGNSEGALWRSVDDHFLSLAGYAAMPGTANVALSATSTTNRVVGRIDAMGTVDTTTRLTTAFSGGNVRSATTVDGSAFWVSGAGSPAGMFIIPFGITIGTQILTNPTSTRVAGVYGGQLYATAVSGTFVSVFTVGSGLPSTPAQTATTLSGLPTSAGPSPYAFVFLDRNGVVPGLDTLYLADDRAAVSGGGIQKWTFDGSIWSLASTINSGLTVGVRGLTATVTGANVTLVATTAEASPNRLVVAVDDGSASPAVTTVATADPNMVFRGVALAPQ